MTTALITGIDGFTGQYLQAELEAAGHRVIGLSATATEQASRYQADLLDADRLAEVIAAVKPQLVAHLAAVSFVAHEDATDFYQVNVTGTYNLLAALARNAPQLQSVLLCSSAAVYGDPGGKVIDEAFPTLPVNDYGVSKLAMEHMARLWLDRLPLTVVRPFNYTGRGQTEKFLLAKIVAHFRQRAPQITLGNLDVTRDFSDVRVVAKLYRRLLELAPVGETFNVCSGQGVSIGAVIDCLGELTGHQIELQSVAQLRRASDIQQLIGDDSRLRALVPEVERFSLAETFSWMLEPAV